MTTSEGITCVHARCGVCPSCERDFEEDPIAWVEFGPHPAGIARWAAHEADMASRTPEPAAPGDGSLPF